MKYVFGAGTYRSAMGVLDWLIYDSDTGKYSIISDTDLEKDREIQHGVLNLTAFCESKVTPIVVPSKENAKMALVKNYSYNVKDGVLYYLNLSNPRIKTKIRLSDFCEVVHHGSIWNAGTDLYFIVDKNVIFEQGFMCSSIGCNLTIELDDCEEEDFKELQNMHMFHNIRFIKRG